MQSGCRWVYTLMDWDTGEVVAKGTSVELVEQGYFPDVNKLSSVWNNLEKCKNPSPKNYRWKMERKSTKDDRVERARAEGLSADERAETRMVRVYSCYGADGTLLGKGTAEELKDRGLFGSVIDPSALAYDVHDLMIYNEKARKIGKPELTYGYWAEKGKPATP